MSDPQIMYRAHFGLQSLSLWHPDSPAPTFCSSMELSPCGQYVGYRRRSLDDQGWESHREELSQYWQPTRALALAAAAPLLRRIGERLIRQAEELEQAARDERQERPALSAAAAHEGGMGRPSGGGE